MVERINSRMATEAILMNSAISTAVASFGKDGGRSARKAFDAMIKRLTGDGA